MPDNVSPDAENNDYQRGSIRRRQGYQRLHSNAVVEGGIQLDNTNGSGTLNNYVSILDDSTLDLDADFTLEIFLRILTEPTANITIITKRNIGGGNTGWDLIYNYTSYRFDFRMYDSGGTLRTISSTAGSLPLIGANIHIAVVRSSTTITVYRDLAAGSGGACSGTANNSDNVLIGQQATGFSTSAQTSSMIVGELRVFNDVRTTTELANCAERGLVASEIADANTTGYWPMTDATWGIVEDQTSNKNHGSISNSNPSSVAGLVPNAGEDGYGMRFRGAGGGLSVVGNLYAQASYDAKWVTITETGNTWTIEGWVRLDRGPTGGATQYIFDLGALLTNSTFRLYIDTSKNLYFSYSTTSTHANEAQDTGYDVVTGTAFHVALVRSADNIWCYINGALQTTETGVTTENGPTASDQNLVMGAISTGLSGFAAITVDEVRLWKSARSQYEVQRWMNEFYPNVSDTNLVGYWRFDAADRDRDETGNSDLANTLADATAYVKWSRGFVYPTTQPRMLMVAPYAQPRRADEVRSGINPFSRDVLVSTHTDLWRIIGSEARQLARLDYAADSSLFGHAHFQNYLVFGNGIEPVRKYDGTAITTLTIAGPSSTLTDTPNAAPSNGTFAATGTYYYRVSFRNSLDGTESLASDPSGGALLAATDDNIDLTSIPVSSNAQVNQRRLYRKDAAATEYYYLADINDNTTTTYTDTGTAVSSTLPIDDLRGDVEECRFATVFGASLIVANSPANPSAIYFSEPDTINFPAANVITVGEGDGDEITGIKAAFGYCIIFKERSIHILSGTGSTTYQVERVVPSQGCVSGATIAESPQGIYYLSHDGVYRYQPGGGIEYVSGTQQELFSAINTERKRFAAAGYNPKTHQYMVSLDVAGDTDTRISMVYDEETQSWARWDAAFDCYAQAELSDNEIALLGTKGGFVYRLFTGNTDGMPIYGDAETTYSGSVTSNATATITDGAATFPTTNNGLAGCKVLVAASAGNQERTILSNTGTSLFLDSPFSPSITGTYYVGAIDWYWESRWLELGDPAVVKRIMYLYLWLREGSATVTLKWKSNQYETWQSTTFSNADEFAQAMTPLRGRKVKFRFEYVVPNKSVEITSFQPVGSVRGLT